MRRTVTALVLPALLTACAGTSSPAAVRAGTGHGSVEEVARALEQQGVPCAQPRPVALPPGTEQAVECLVGRDLVLLVHFVGRSGSSSFEATTRRAGLHGVFADTWAIRTRSAKAAEAVAAALAHRATA